MALDMANQCPRCSFCCPSKYQLLKHLFEAHSTDKDFKILCPGNDCLRSFVTFTSLLGHANRKHPMWKEQLEIAPKDNFFSDSWSSGCLGTGSGESSNHDIAVNSSPLPSDDQCDNHQTVNSNVDLINVQNQTDLDVHNDSDENLIDEDYGHDKRVQLQTVAAKFLLTLKEQYRMSQAALDFTLNAVKDITALHSSVIKDHQSLSEALNPFEGVETEHMQNKFYREHFGLVEPITVQLGASFVYQQRGVKRQLIEKRDTFQYVPLLDNLQSLLSNKEIYNEVTVSHQRTDELYGDVCDAQLFREHPLYSQDPLALQLLIYFDEVEVVNPLGAHRGVHKLGLFYYSLGNIRPALRSGLKVIQLIAIVTTPLLNEYGYDKVLEPFFRDANKLTQGIQFNLNGRKQLFRGCVLLMLADMLAAHSIGGFKVGVGFSLRKCRDCLATKQTMTEFFRHEDFVPRTKESYDYHCSLLGGDFAAADSVTYGVNFQSALNQLHYFHVANSQLPQDIMHVLLEGVVKMELSLLLNYLVSSRYMTESLLNDRIENFHYTIDEKRNKPCPIDLKSSSFHQTAEQMWILTTYLPLLIGDRVPPDTDQWECFLLLLEILYVCTARLTSKDLSQYLAGLVEEHHRQFRRCYPSVPFTPKLHVMVHFSNQIIRTGPLISSWCMRMEAKHNWFKKIAQIGNFKNIALSLARRHQHLMCLHLNQEDFFGKTPTHGPVISTTDEYDEDINVPESPPGQVIRTKWVKLSGYTYQPNYFVLTGFQEDDLPIFSRICDILLQNERPMVQVVDFHTDGILQHYHSYSITPINNKHIICLHDLIEPRPFNSHLISGVSSHVVTLRSIVIPFVNQ